MVIDYTISDNEPGQGMGWSDHYRKKNKVRGRVAKGEKCLVKLGKRIW